MRRRCPAWWSTGTAPLFFANAANVRQRALAAVDGQPEPVRWFVLNTEANVEVDSTALDALETLHAKLTGRGVVFALARVNRPVRAARRRRG